MTNYDVSFYCTHCLPRWIHFALLLVIVHQMENLNLSQEIYADLHTEREENIVNSLFLI